MSTHPRLIHPTPKYPGIHEADDHPPPYSSPAPPDEGPPISALVVEAVRNHPASGSHYSSYSVPNPTAARIHDSGNFHEPVLLFTNPTPVYLSNQSGFQPSPLSSQHFSSSSLDPIVRNSLQPPFVLPQHNTSSSLLSPSQRPTAPSHFFSRRNLIVLAITGVFVIGWVVGGVVGGIAGKRHVSSATPESQTVLPSSSAGIPTVDTSSPLSPSPIPSSQTPSPSPPDQTPSPSPPDQPPSPTPSHQNPPPPLPSPTPPPVPTTQTPSPITSSSSSSSPAPPASQSQTTPRDPLIITSPQDVNCLFQCPSNSICTAPC
ncbi:hypothetical protein JAAARDRAFT_198365 [Jaapia argillacea MUCL 33604]|uniref:Uncharacterized protein n=1 Tax=Jaapia argillacea MUCL 33604 TaxID=933084 RepID=A0A067PMC4_9AGAM|nr:hypothetical protein JAAARDRAFT_198365 [Jaapia argillacea MUCL 33604]